MIQIIISVIFFLLFLVYTYHSIRARSIHLARNWKPTLSKTPVLLGCLNSEWEDQKNIIGNWIQTHTFLRCICQVKKNDTLSAICEIVLYVPIFAVCILTFNEFIHRIKGWQQTNGKCFFFFYIWRFYLILLRRRKQRWWQKKCVSVRLNKCWTCTQFLTFFSCVLLIHLSLAACAELKHDAKCE